MKWISFIALLPLAASALPVLPGENFRVQIPGEYIVNVKNSFNKSAMNVKKRLGKNLFLVSAQEGSEASEIGLPNYAYFGNYMEMARPNDEMFSNQFHHEMIGTIGAWDITKGSSEIIVAVTDNEFMVEHEDLKNQWYVNANEIPNNNIDDDNNGYVDDVIGWDFIGQDNEVAHKTVTHGTHVAGIIAAETGNKVGGAGIAPGVKVMPLRWYGDDAPWTSAVVAETYHYAVDNGAKIINTSYNIDGLVDDQVYLNAIEYATSNGVLIFNSAGNSGKKDPARGVLDDLILVCSVKSKSWGEDKKSSFSNYGKGIDICAPGDPILAPLNLMSQKVNKYGKLQGTSMASPAAAAVAALIWSAHPNFSAEEVKQRLYESADSIEKRNFWYRGKLGHGRINALEAVK
ncbi:MAG: S8 family serine peptidase [Bacteriovoracaceae bacterium]|nr:S8 family serine peptidase [Bacteriovoracaceae bacterium]